LKKRTSINSNSHFHKEKEMADFRKWFLAFALVALLLGAGTANAQQQPNTQLAFSCTANAGTPVIVRVEGITELVGDLVLQCTGGQPTLFGQPVATTNLRLTLNTNITSRLLGGGFIDALLLIDDPYPGAVPTTAFTHPGTTDANVPSIFAAPNIPPNSPTQALCAPNTSPVAVTPAGPPNCNFMRGTGVANSFYGGAGSPYLQANQTNNVAPVQTSVSTVFEARQVSANGVEWDGIPIDPPGTTGIRLVRLTNVRANACQLGLSSTLIPTQIVGFIGITGGQFFTINNPQQTLAFINVGLITSAIGNTAQQCNNLNVGGGGVGGNFFAGSATGIAVSSVNVREGFAQSFKRQQFTPQTTISGLGGVGNPGASGPLANAGIFYNTAPQNVPGLAYNTESGFQPTGLTAGTQLNGNLGTANFGTRILLRFANLGTGLRLVLPGVVALTIDNGATPANPLPPSAVGGWTGGYLVLLGTSDLQGNVGVFTNGFSSAGSFSNSSFFFSSGPFKGPGAVAPFNNAFETVVTAGAAGAVYEVVNSDPSAIEQANIPMGVAFISNTGQNLPPAGQGTVNASFAPLSTDATASGSDFIPRFCDNSVARNAINIVVCQCNLLFPFVTQAAGFDTGIAIANTTTDPFGTTPQTGPVAFFFYGQTTGGGALPAALAAQKTTGNVPSGQVLTYTTFGGAGAFAAGLQPVPGFTGYLITQANFQFCHGFAFISDLGAQKLAEGYLAIQLDIYGGTGLNRTGIVGEVQGH
jgi:hypothetical protein